MKYYVRFNEKTYVTNAGNSIHACIKYIQHMDTTGGIPNINSYFYVSQQGFLSGEFEKFHFCEIVHILFLSRQATLEIAKGKKMGGFTYEEYDDGEWLYEDDDDDLDDDFYDDYDNDYELFDDDYKEFE